MDINELRAEVLRRQRAANAKVARLRRKGVQVAGTGFDVRRDNTNVGRYNVKQLQSYLGELNSFTSRRNAFVPGSEGVPIRAEKWRAYARAQKQYNAIAETHYAGVADTKLRNQDHTVSSFDTKVRTKRPANNNGVVRPLEPVERESFQVVNERRLDALRRQLERKSSADYLPKTLRKQRARMNQLVSEFGDQELTKMAKELTAEQFDTLWNYSDAPRDLFGGYHFLKLLAAGKADEAQANIHEDDKHEVREWLGWAKNLPSRQNGKNRK